MPQNRASVSLALPNLKALDKKLKITQNLNLFFQRVENIVEKGENASYQHVHLFHDAIKELVATLGL